MPPEFPRPRHPLVKTENMTGDVIEVNSAIELPLHVGDQTSDHIIAGIDHFVHPEQTRIHLRQHPRVLVGLPPDHHPVHMPQVSPALLDTLYAAVDYDSKLWEILLESIDPGVVQRRNLPVLLRRQTLQPGLAGMHDKHRTTRRGDGFDKPGKLPVGLHLIDADTVLHRDRDIAGIHHGLDAVRHQLWLGHQAGAEHPRLHPVRGAAAVQVDLVVAPFLGPPGTARQLCRVGTAELQRHRVLLGIEMQEALPVTVNQGAGGDHLRVQQRLFGEQAPEIPAVVVRPVHHGCYGK